MNDAMDPGDFGREFHDAFGDEIAMALAPDKPDADAFAEGVREKVDVLGADRTPRTWSPFVRRVAAVLPPVLVPLSLARSGTAATVGVVASKLGWKVVPLVLALPLAILIAGVTTLFFALRSQPAPKGPQVYIRDWKDLRAQKVASAWWASHFKQIALVVVVTIAIGVFAPIEAAILTYFTSLLAVLGVTGALTKAGFGSRDAVTQGCVMCSMYLVMFGGSLRYAVKRVSSNPALELLAVDISGACVVLSGVLCLAQVRGHVGRRVLFSVLLVGMALPKFLARSELEPVDAETLQEAVLEWTEGSLEAETVREFGEWCHVVRVLAQTPRGRGLPTDAMRERAEQILDTIELEDDPRYFRVSGAARLGVFASRHNAAWAERRSLVRELDDDSPLSWMAQRAFEIDVHMRALGLDEEARERMARRAIAGALERPRVENLDGTLWILESLDRLQDSDALTATAHTLLLECWTGPVESCGGCFAPYASLIDRDERGDVSEDRLTFVWLDATGMAIEIMARLGVPEGIDLWLLDDYLAKQSIQYPSQRVRMDHLHAAALRERIRMLPGWTDVRPEDPGDTVAWIRSVALVLGAVLFAVFCLIITFRAPHAASGEPA